MRAKLKQHEWKTTTILLGVGCLVADMLARNL
jgi:hypothetical protein